MGLTLTGFGSAVPEQSANAQEALYVAQHVMRAPKDQHRRIAALYRGSRVQKRHCCLLKPRSQWRDGPEFNVLFPPQSDGERGPSTADRMRAYEEHAFPLALSAARKALAAGGMKPQEITHLITVTCTGFFAPGIDIKLMQALGMQPTVERAQVGFMGCQGSMNGLRVANGFAHANRDARVLMCSVELCTLHYYYGWNLKDTLANALFADGAAAVVGTTDTPDQSGTGGGSGTAGWDIQATGSFLVPDSHEAMSWHVRDHGFIMGLSPSVPKLIEQHLESFMTPWLARQGLEIDDIETWAVHPGGPGILTSAQTALSLPDDALDVSWDILRNYGNMSSATILFILERLKKAGARGPCVALAFGPGLMCEAVLFNSAS